MLTAVITYYQIFQNVGLCVVLRKEMHTFYSSLCNRSVGYMTNIISDQLKCCLATNDVYVMVTGIKRNSGYSDQS